MRQIRFVRVTRSFGDPAHPAVDDVSFQVEAGAFVVLLGPSGSGKTTLLKMVNRLLEPSSGQIFIDGEEIHTLPADELRRKIGYVIQQAGLFPHMTVARNIAVVPRLLGWRKERIRDRVDELLELVGLTPAQLYRDRYPGQLSGGEQQRVGVARALAAGPGLLLMDEPFGALDAITRTSLQAEMQELHERVRATILFVTHDVEEALSLADRIAVVRRGRLVQYAPPAELLLRPADDFVAELVGANDTMRKLRLISVAEALALNAGVRAPALLGDAPQGRSEWAPAASPAPASARKAAPPDGDVVAPEDSLRDALAALAEGGADEVPVMADGHLVGAISLAIIQEILHDRQGSAPDAATGAGS